MLKMRRAELAVSPRQSRRANVVDCVEHEVDAVIGEYKSRGMMLRSCVPRVGRKGHSYVQLTFEAVGPEIENRTAS